MTKLTDQGPITETRRAATRLRWWRELLIVMVFYQSYSWVRNQFGSAVVEPATALANARRVIDVESALGLYHEARIQSWFIDWEGFIRFWNIFYGSFHFIVTPATLIFLYRSHPHTYPRQRTIFLTMTGLALIGFAALPLMPPRLLGDCGIYGGCIDNSTYVDTVHTIGGLWSFDSGAVANLSNQYAAMPSLHFGWSFWCFLVLYPRLRNRALRVLVALYPWFTAFCVVVTANHYWLDAAGGGMALAVAYMIGTMITKVLQSRGFDLGIDPMSGDVGTGARGYGGSTVPGP